MSLQSRNLKDTIGTEVTVAMEDLLRPEVAREVRNLLVDRGVLVFPKLGISDDEQLQLASLIGTVREEGGSGIFKITLDNKANAQALYLKGSWLWHMDGTHDHPLERGDIEIGVHRLPVGGRLDPGGKDFRLHFVEIDDHLAQRAGFVSDGGGSCVFSHRFPLSSTQLSSAEW